MRKGDTLDHFFLGPKSEQRRFLQDVVDFVVEDYLYWRRNYHPKDPPAIAYKELHTPEAAAYRGRFHQELFELISDLKLDVPFFSPRYMAHMVSEVALPGLVAYLATMLYNPNNVSLEASPVTVNFELEVGRQLAELFGFEPETSFGHLCSGGTVANYESLWFCRAGRFLPLAVALACRHEDFEEPEGLPGTVWELLNVPLAEAETFYDDFCRQALAQDRQPLDVLRRWSLDAYGDADYRQLVQETFGESYASPVVIMPGTAHYCWYRAAGLLGFGRRQLLKVDVDAGFHMDPESYRAVLERCLEEKRPILQSVFVLGTTEFGSVDPLPELFEARDEARAQGLDSPVHVDAAYGGYFATIFRVGESGDEAPRVPHLENLRRSCAVLHRAVSVTVDPHKMGYAPYGAGAIVLRHGYLRHLVSEGAHYALDTRGLQHEDLGKFILEGSKPGAAAAAVWFNHRMMPLDLDGYGHQLLHLCRLAHVFHSLVTTRNAQLEEDGKPYRLLPVIRPETNIVCLLALPTEAESLREVDELNGKAALRFGVRDLDSVQGYDFLVSKTRLDTSLAFVTSHAPLARLEQDSECLTCLRLVFMNRWVAGEDARGRGYMDGFLDALGKFLEEALS